MKEFDTETLAAFNGKDGQPVYVAHDGRVFDVSASRMWKAGQHMKRHTAGRDLTADIQAAPHGPEVLERYSQVGILKTKKEEAERPAPDPLADILERFPILRRHPHPMLVHFPIVFMIAPVMFLVLYLISGIKSFEATAFHCLGAGIFFLIPAILTGFLTWRINYMAKPMRPVQIKINLSFTLLCLSTVAFIWRFMQPEVFGSFSGSGIVYFLLIFLLVPLVGVVGWYGAALTFPMEKK